MTRSIFFIGATGYIGSTALDRIMKADKDAKITVLGRKPDVLKGFEAVDPRISTVQGSLEDCDLLEELASKHDITVNCADADNIKATEAILRGIQKRHKETGNAPILIHTSGTGTLCDDNIKAEPSSKVYTDWEAEPSANPPLLPISSLPDSSFHRNVDQAIVRADAQGYVHAYIILPSTIYGLSQTVFAEKGLVNPQSQQVPLLIRISIDRGAAAMVGPGGNLWPDVHIHDCGDLFALVYKTAISGNGGDHGSRGYYFAESGEHSLKQVAEQIGKDLKQKGLAESAEPKSLSKEEMEKYLGDSGYFAANSRARGVHSRKIGWKPAHTIKDFMASIAEDIDYTIKTGRGKDKSGKYVFDKGPVLINGGWRLPEA